jgi:GntR family transcriptional regulator/MocR family aminotransferase
LRDSADAAFGYGDVRGAPELRHALAGYLGRSRGAVAEPERILVCSGFVQGLSLICRALRARGVRRIALEDPGWLGTQAVVTAAGLEAVPVPVDQDGLAVDRLSALDVGAVVVTPAPQSPTGVVLAPDRRAALLAWADRAGAVVIEDDYDAEYRYGREPVGALQGLAPDRVAYAGSASKILAPGLRLGWLVLPTWLAAPVAAEKATDDLGTPVLEQLTLADFIARGELDRHLRRMRTTYPRRRDALVATLDDRAPWLEVTGIAAGLHATVRLPEGNDEHAIVEEARRRRIAVGPMAENWTDPRGRPPTLLLGYGQIQEAAIRPAVRALAEAIRAT